VGENSGFKMKLYKMLKWGRWGKWGRLKEKGKRKKWGC